MITIYMWAYTFILALLWWLFAIAKIHAYKFKAFSKNITTVTNILLIFLTILSILWYFLIYYSLSNTTTQVENYTGTNINEINY
jgi:hypothetical protein